LRPILLYFVLFRKVGGFEAGEAGSVLFELAGHCALHQQNDIEVVTGVQLGAVNGSGGFGDVAADLARATGEVFQDGGHVIFYLDRDLGHGLGVLIFT
jgi:hypothetical protein